MNIETMAKIIEAEASVLPYEGKLAVAQCIVDNGMSTEPFTTPADTYSQEPLRAAQEALAGVKRFPWYKLLQFRSYANYGAYGAPDWEKIHGGKWPIPPDLIYLGKDGTSEWGHYYFGGLNMKILLDAGHYGSYYNQSPAVPEYYESNFTWKFQGMLAEELRKRGVVVGITRSNKEDNPGLVERGKMARNYDVLISLHSNAVGSGVNESVDYPLAYVMSEDGFASTDYDYISQSLGLILARLVGEIMDCKQPATIFTRNMGTDRNGDGIVDAEDEYYGVLYGARQVKKPAIILEHSFHTNTRSTRWLMDDNNLRKLAAAESDQIITYFAGSGTYEVINGTLRIVYGGADGVNLHKTADLLPDSVIGTLQYNEIRRAIGVLSKPDGTTLYRLEDGEYITASGSYVQYTTNAYDTYVAKCNVAGLNVRDFPSSLNDGGKIIAVLGKDNLVDVVGECYNHGQKWLMVRVKLDEKYITGYAAEKYFDEI